MPLTLRAVSLNDQPITQPITAQLRPAGRLDRPGRHQHACRCPTPSAASRAVRPTIARVGARASSIKNVGSANPIIVRDQSLALGESAPLRDGDQVRIGGYLLEVTADDADERRRTAFDACRASPADPFAALIAGAASWPGAVAASPRRSRRAGVSAFLARLPTSAAGLGRQSVRRVARRSSSAGATFPCQPESASHRRRAGCPMTSIPSRRRPPPRRCRAARHRRRAPAAPSRT